jgi:hypothetical protein
MTSARPRRRSFLLIAASLVVPAFVFAQTRQPGEAAVTQPAMPAPIARIVAAVNQGDMEAFLDQFPEDGVVDDWGSLYGGHAAIEAWLKREVTGVKQTWTVTRVESSGDEVSIFAHVGGGGFNGPSRFRFTLADGLVKKMKITDK